MNMDLAFNWDAGRARYHPETAVLPSGDAAVSIVGDVLRDDGGLGVEKSISWIAIGIERLQSVVLGQVDAVEWARETFGVSCDRTRARIYFLLDEDYWVDVNPLVLLALMSVWREFLLAGPTDERGDLNSAIVPLGERDLFVLAESVQ